MLNNRDLCTANLAASLPDQELDLTAGAEFPADGVVFRLPDSSGAPQGAVIAKEGLRMGEFEITKFKLTDLVPASVNATQGYIARLRLEAKKTTTGSIAVISPIRSRMTLNALDEEDNKDKDKPKDQVTLLTLHGAKGLEYSVVFLVGLEEGFLPHRRTIEEAQDFSEERRLCYVGITRAKEHLILTRAKNRIRYGKPVPRNPSRFLEELPPHLLVQRDESYSPDLSSKEAKEKHETKVKDFLANIRAQILSN